MDFVNFTAMKTITLTLTESEKAILRKHRIRKADITNYAADELEVLLQTTFERAREIRALAEFQQAPSVGIRFAEDLVFMGYYSLDELKNKNGTQLTDEFEIKKGYWIDPCVEDQFRLAVHYANTRDRSKNWWDFTAERKEFRLKNCYPSVRPTKAWHEFIRKK